MTRQTLQLSISILLLLSNFRLLGQDISDYGIKSLGQKDGLLSSKITSILKDQKGFVWIGTDNGLNKFDGKNIEQICLGSPCEELSQNYIKDIHETEDGTLVIAGKVGAFIMPKDRSEIIPLELGEAPNQALSIDSKGESVFIGTRNGVYRTRITNGIAKKTTQLDIPCNEVSELILKGTELWIGTWRKGIFIYNTENNTSEEFHASYKVSLKGDSIRNVMAFAKDTDNGLWVGDFDYGLFHIDKNKNVEKFSHNDSDPNSLNSNKIKSLTFDEKGYLWIGLEESGIDRFSPGFKEFRHYYADFQDESLYEGYSIYSCYVDDQEQIWLGFRNDGLKIIPLTPSIFESVNFSQEKSKNIAVGLASNRGKLLVGTKGGLIIGDPQKQQEAEFFPLPNNESPMAVYPLNDEKILLGTMRGSILEFDHPTKTFKQALTEEAMSAFKNLKINTFLSINENLLLIGSQAGTFTYNFSEKSLSQISSSWTHTFLNGNEGEVYMINFGTDQNVFLPETGKVIELEIDIARNVKAGVLLDNDLYLGSDLGFFKYNIKTKKLTHFEDIYPLVHNQINALVKDRKNRIWASSQESLICYDPNGGHFRVFSTFEGLPENRYRDEMVTHLPNGNIVFGGNEGLTIIDPQKFEFAPSNKNVEFTSIQINENSQNISRLTSDKNGYAIELEHTENNLNIYFNFLDYKNTSHHKYQYRFNGHKNWQNLGPENNVTLVGLDPGDHKFHVRAADANGFWSEEKSLNISVNPPLFRSSLFIFMYIAIGTIVIFGIFKFRSKQLRLEKDYEIEHLKAENIREKLDREADFHNMRLLFFTNISHEFRTPLTLILAPLEKFIQRGIQPSSEHLQLMYRNAERLRRLVSQILDFRKMEAGELKYEPAVGDLIKYTKECTKLFIPIAQQKNINFEANFDSESLLVTFDKDKYEKIIINLLSNAFKFTDKGQISLNLVHHNLDDGKVKIEIVLKDTGSGIDEEHIEHIFDRYFHVKTKFSENNNGTGIGLALVKQLVIMHNGDINVESKKDLGTTFTATLILESNTTEVVETKITDKVEVKEIAFEAETEQEQQEENHLPTLLVVEDDTDLREYVKVEFHSTYRIIEACNGEEGYKSAIKHIPDIIICDISMPVMDGLEMSEKIKKDERTNHIPIILLTAHGSLVHQKKGFELGAEDFIVKPFSTDILGLRINNLLRSRKELQDKFRKEFKVEPNGLPTTSMDQTFLNKAMSVVEENLNNTEFNASQFAEEMCMSRVHLYRKLKALTNESVSGFVKMVRMKLAADLIKDKKMSIKEAAYTVGFSDPKYFSKCFKQQFGMKPSEFAESFTEEMQSENSES